MQIFKREITEERYKELDAMTYAEQKQSLFPDGLPADWEYGYGYYGHALVRSEGKCFVQFKIGDSCD